MEVAAEHTDASNFHKTMGTMVMMMSDTSRADDVRKGLDAGKRA